ncbi:MAG: HAD family hydrolase [Bacteroidales bacterium]
MTRALFFDNDGVLVDTERLYFAATKQVLERAGFGLSEEEFRQWFLVEGRGAWHVLEAACVLPDEIARLKDERNSVYAGMLDRADFVIEGVREVLEALHGRYVMGVVTSSRRDHFERMHRFTGLMPYFDFVLANGDYARSKPHPDPYLAAIGRSGVPKEQCLAIEDSERGLRSALAAGIRCVVLPTDLTRALAFDGACRVLARISELPALIASLDATSA